MKLSKRAEKALSGSIKKWTKIVNGTGVDKGIANCPLCKLYHNNDCVSCPVRRYTGHIFCRSTPYISWTKHHNETKFNHFGNMQCCSECPKCKKLARKELNFLIKVFKHYTL